VSTTRYVALAEASVPRQMDVAAVVRRQWQDSASLDIDCRFTLPA
jgi:hypothetical protein